MSSQKNNSSASAKRSYEKPVVVTIDLAADEVLAIGCKTISGGFNSGASPCATNSCANIGS